MQFLNYGLSFMMHITRRASRTISVPAQKSSYTKMKHHISGHQIFQHIYKRPIPLDSIKHSSRVEITGSSIIGGSSTLKAAHSARHITTYLNTATPRLCKPCPYPTTYVPDINQFNQEQYTELALHFQEQVKDLWEKVWFGLYQARDGEKGKTSSHASRIRKLYAGAGMAELLGKTNSRDAHRIIDGKWELIGLGSLSQALCEPSAINSSQDSIPVLGRLKIYDGIALDNLQHVIILLREYKRQADAVSELYMFLEQHQIKKSSNQEKKQDVYNQYLLLRGFRARATSISAALCELDKQMISLQRDMDDEAMEIYGCLDGVECMHIKEEVLNSQISFSRLRI